jgi:ketosteroid isomerase-like protein
MTIELAQRYAEAMEAKDLAAVRALLDDHVVVVTPKGTVLEGIDAVCRYFSGPGFDHLVVSTEDHEFELHGRGVRQQARQIYRWKETGEDAYERPLETTFEFREGRITRVEMRLLGREAAA